MPYGTDNDAFERDDAKAAPMDMTSPARMMQISMDESDDRNGTKKYFQFVLPSSSDSNQIMFHLFLLFLFNLLATFICIALSIAILCRIQSPVINVHPPQTRPNNLIVHV